MSDTTTIAFAGRVVIRVLPDGSAVGVDPARHEVEVGHPNAWASNMRHALVAADGSDIYRGPQWQVERCVTRRVARVAEAAQVA